MRAGSNPRSTLKNTGAPTEAQALLAEEEDIMRHALQKQALKAVKELATVG